MFRALLTIAAVAGLSFCIARIERAQAQRPVRTQLEQTTWVRTVDGWEPSVVLSLEPRAPVNPPVHPALVASFELTASLFALLAFPTANRRLAQKRVGTRLVRSRKKTRPAQLQG